MGDAAGEAVPQSKTSTYREVAVYILMIVNRFDQDWVRQASKQQSEVKQKTYYLVEALVKINGTAHEMLCF